MNISPVIGDLFSTTKSMQNAHVLTQTNGCNKYVFKYISKIDDNNYVITFSNAHKNGLLQNHAHFMYNTTITSSKKNM